MPDLADLIERLEKATEGSRELDCKIALAVGWTRIPPSETRGHRGGSHGYWMKPGDMRGWDTDYQRDPPEFSRFLDAALTLVPEGWFFSLMHAAPDFLVAGQPAFSAEVHGPVSWVRPEPSGYEEPVFDSTAAGAATPALALAIAALKARQAAS